MLCAMLDELARSAQRAEKGCFPGVHPARPRLCLGIHIEFILEPFPWATSEPLRLINAMSGVYGCGLSDQGYF